MLFWCRVICALRVISSGGVSLMGEVLLILLFKVFWLWICSEVKWCSSLLKFGYSCDRVL